jgi:phospholipid transport system substrate-binding protein
MGMSRETTANGVASPWRRIGAVAVVLVAAYSPPAGAATTAQGVVDQFHRSLIGVMTRARELGYHGRFAALSPEIARAFHIPVMTRIVAGSHWKSFSSDQKSALVEAFGRMTAATYANRFDGFSGEQFRTLGEEPTRRKSVLVKSEIVKSDGEAIAINYLMRKFKSGWRVVDVQLKGAYSELATRRSEYSSILRRSGLTALLAEIRNKVAAYEAEARGK